MYRGRTGWPGHSISGAEWVKVYKDQEIINCIRYHHYQDIKDADLDKGMLPVVYLADIYPPE